MFDSLEFATPFTITLKIKDIWKRGLDWDGILPAEYQDRMEKWIDGMTEMRPIPWNDIEEKELSVFTDAKFRVTSQQYHGTTLKRKSSVSSPMLNSASHLSNTNVTDAKFRVTSQQYQWNDIEEKELSVFTDAKFRVTSQQGGIPMNRH
ncbi:hypothetical protein RRG08_063169 [Elysia crispata]|uniref:Uncharacterized protein n=1 Tax=Elysia crispata TaxID=231223 RepID=A0AAE1DWF2_9GAST|nr:hypothetical protein RRG08_063169 [Elysia crispata]